MRAVEALLNEFCIPIGSHYCDVEVKTRRDLDGDWHARYVATMRPYLAGVLEITIESGTDPDERMRKIVDEKLRPFQQKLDRASEAAAAAWDEVMAA